MSMSPNQLLVHAILEELPRDTSTIVHSWLDQEVESMDRAVIATRADGKLILAIRGGHILLLVPHAQGIDTVDWGEVRGLSVTTHRRTVSDGLLDVKYTLGHPSIEALNLEIDLTYVDADARVKLLRDLTPFTKSTN
jgi:hypothetical protein